MPAWVLKNRASNRVNMSMFCNGEYFTVNTVFIFVCSPTCHFVNIYEKYRTICINNSLHLFCDLFVHDDGKCRVGTYNGFMGNPPTATSKCVLHIQRSSHRLTLHRMVLKYLTCYSCRNVVSRFPILNDRSYDSILKCLGIIIFLMECSWKKRNSSVNLYFFVGSSLVRKQQYKFTFPLEMN